MWPSDDETLASSRWYVLREINLPLLKGGERAGSSDSDSEAEMLEDGQSEMWEEEEVEVSPEDEAAMAAFMNSMAKQRTLADIILEKIQEKQQRQALQEEG